MIVDTSALMSILLEEPDGERFARCLEDCASASMSTATLVEVGVVALRRTEQPDISAVFRLVERAGISVTPFDEEQAHTAIGAYARFGRGMGHPARLNFGDCFSYALAKVRDEPLLYKGDDFAQTDIRSAL